jgi:membrane glycosyltransferase
MTPQEIAPAAVIRRYRAIVDVPDAAGHAAGQKPRWLAALIDPLVYRLHRMQLPPDEPTRRQRHQLDGLMYTLIDQGEDALDVAERRAMITNATCLKRIHIGLWSELPLERLAVGDLSSSITAG